MFRSIVLIASFLVLAKSQRPTELSQCTINEGSLPFHVNLQGCVVQPCLLPQLQDAVFDVAFHAPRSMTRMMTLATAYMSLGIGIAFPIPYHLGEQEETCNFLLNANCPVIEGRLILYQLKLHIDLILPVGTQVPVEFRIVDDNNVPFACWRVLVRITEPWRISGGNSTLIDTL